MRRSLSGEPGEQGREVWISAALQVLASEGLDAVRIERLARKLKITKGSFYHHFADRGDLHGAMLERWRERLVVEGIAELDRIAEPQARFAAILQTSSVWTGSDRDIELAVRLWARHDAGAAATYREAERLRLSCIRRALSQCGVAEAEVQARAVLTLAFLRDAPELDGATAAACRSLLLPQAADAPG